ncbi:copper homeostasis protein CutC, partial [bacterium]|nr:copper homeostasis protein CutC [candidate division CSSED10-310 bacterium]
MKAVSPILIEACVTSVPCAIGACQAGARRVELCDNLYAGGTTPGPGSIQAARAHLEIDLHVMIRPRGGDFLYSTLEFEIMKSEIQFCRDHHVDGIVFGILRSDGTVDIDRCAELIGLAGTMSTTFHRAFDMTRDPFAALNDLIALGIHRILTSGQRPSAREGIDLIADLVQAAGRRIIIMPGVGIDPFNAAHIMKQSGAREFHVYTHTIQFSRMEYRNPDVFMGTDRDFDEYALDVID